MKQSLHQRVELALQLDTLLMEHAKPTLVRIICGPLTSTQTEAESLGKFWIYSPEIDAAYDVALVLSRRDFASSHARWLGINVMASRPFMSRMKYLSTLMTRP
jgi:hypothetical protein